MRPTAKDLAEAAGVSLATVDRVLNERPTVSPKAARRVAGAYAFVARDPSAAAKAKLHECAAMRAVFGGVIRNLASFGLLLATGAQLYSGNCF